MPDFVCINDPRIMYCSHGYQERLSYGIAWNKEDNRKKKPVIGADNEDVYR